MNRAMRIEVWKMTLSTVIAVATELSAGLTAVGIYLRFCAWRKDEVPHGARVQVQAKVVGISRKELIPDDCPVERNSHLNRRTPMHFESYIPTYEFYYNGAIYRAIGAEHPKLDMKIGQKCDAWVLPRDPENIWIPNCEKGEVKKKLGNKALLIGSVTLVALFVLKFLLK